MLLPVPISTRVQREQIVASNMAEDDDSDVPETGAVFCFGKTQFADNQPSKFWIRDDIVLHVACGDEHTALVTASGRVFTFGNNEWGQLGHGHTKIVNKPTCVKGLKHTRAILVACGRSHTLVATDSGSVYGFGANGEGQLGRLDSSAEDTYSVPKHIQGLEGLAIKMLCGGAEHSMALTDKGIIYVWGGNSEGQLGLPDRLVCPIPTELKFDIAAIYISAGYYHSAVITGDGKVYTCGESEGGKLGLSETQLKKLYKPQLVTGISGKVVSVSCGGNHTVVLCADGTTYCFGDGSSGQLGLGTGVFNASLPEHLIFSNQLKIARVSCGENHTAFLTNNGQVYTCGDDRHGKLGLVDDDESCDSFIPNLITKFHSFQVQQICCGGCHTLVVASKAKFSNANSVNDQVAENNHAVINNADPILEARQRRRQRNLPPISPSATSKLSIEENSENNPLNKTKLPNIGGHESGIVGDDDDDADMSESENNSIDKSVKRRSLLQEAEEDESIRHADSDLESEVSEISCLNKTHALVVDENNEAQLKPVKAASNSNIESTDENKQEKLENNEAVNDMQKVLNTNGASSNKTKTVAKNISNMDKENEIETLSEHIIDVPKEKETSKFSWFTLRRQKSKETATTSKIEADAKEKQSSRHSLFKGKETSNEEDKKSNLSGKENDTSKKKKASKNIEASTLSRETHSQSPGTSSHKSKACIIL